MKIAYKANVANVARIADFQRPRIQYVPAMKLQTDMKSIVKDIHAGGTGSPSRNSGLPVAASQTRKPNIIRPPTAPENP